MTAPGPRTAHPRRRRFRRLWLRLKLMGGRTAGLLVPTGAVSRSYDDGATRAIRNGVVVCLVFFGILGTWSAVASIAGAAIAPGQLKAAANRQSVQHRYGGIVSELLVREGEVVQQGQVLVRLDDTGPRSQVTQLQSDLDGVLAMEARLAAERDGADVIAFQPSLQQEPQRPSARDAIANQSALFRERKRQQEVETAVLGKKINQLQEQIRGRRAEIVGLERQSELIEEEAKGVRELFQKGFAPKTRVLALERTAAELMANRGSGLADIARSEQAIAETELTIAKAQQTRITEITDQIRQSQAERARIEPQLITAQDMLQRTELTAPASGAVVSLAVFTVGGVIQAGATVLDIVPSAGQLIVDAKLRPQDVDQVSAGAKAEVRFTALQGRDRPVVDGVVETVSADQIADDRTGEGYYSLRIAMSPASVANAKIELQSGMPVQVLVTTRPRSVLSYLIAPLRDELATAFREQ